jgi:hypothetical protein
MLSEREPERESVRAMRRKKKKIDEISLPTALALNIFIFCKYSLMVCGNFFSPLSLFLNSSILTGSGLWLGAVDVSSDDVGVVVVTSLIFLSSNAKFDKFFIFYFFRVCGFGFGRWTVLKSVWQQRLCSLFRSRLCVESDSGSTTN